MRTEAIDAPVEVSGLTPERETTLDVIRWTRQADGTYRREGNLPAEMSTARIFVIDESHVECPGTKLWPKDEAIALVERKIAEGSYKAWWYEVRPETPTAVNQPDDVLVVPPQQHSRTCANPRCKKGCDGTRGEVKSRRAKYCCDTCRVDVCRRNRREANPEQAEKPGRKPRSDKRFETHAARQRAYDARRGGTERLSRMSVYDLADGAQR